MKLITADGYTLALNEDGWGDGDLFFDALENDAGQAMACDLYNGDFHIAEIRMCEDSEELVIKFNAKHVDATELVDKYFPSFDSENVAVEFHDDAAVWVSMWFEPFDLGRTTSGRGESC
tara:strand:- start:327 stop:683 length:357 start_codon:yes stop_codon:yes gene_type:complete